MSGFLRVASQALGIAAAIVTVAGNPALGAVLGLASAATATGSQLTAKRPVNERQGLQLQFKIDPDGPIPFGMGRYATGGTLAHRETYGTDNSYQTSFVVLGGGGPYAGIETFTADRAAVALSGTSALGYYANWLWQDQQLGATPEGNALGSGIVGKPPYGTAGAVPGWGAAYKLSGFAAASLTLLFDTKARRYAQGEPMPGWIMRGRLVYDPRLDSTYPGGSGPCRWADPADAVAHAAARATWVYSTSPALHGLAWRLGIWMRDETNPAAQYQKIGGIGAPIDLIDVPAIVFAANVQEANGWTIGGEVDSSQDRWEVLKLIEQAGGAEPISVGAMMSTLVKAPRIPLRTITQADCADGPMRSPAMRSRSERINGYRARFRSEPHGWEMTSIDIVQVPDYVAADGRAKTGSGDYSLVTDPDQCAELAAYEVFDSREIEPIEVSLKPFAVEYRIGDCLTLDLPDIGLQARDVIIRGRSVAPATSIVTLTCRTETAEKHPAALGLTGATPPTPTLTADPDAIATPSGAAWSAIMGYAVEAGIQVPAIIVSGAVDNANADGILFDYRRIGSDDWTDTGISPPDTTSKVIVAIEPGTFYEVGVRYRGRGIYSPRLTLTPGVAPEARVDWPVVAGPGRPADNATNSADPNSPLGDGTVGGALGRLTEAERIANEIRLRTETLEDVTIPSIDAATAAANDRIDAARAAVDAEIDRAIGAEGMLSERISNVVADGGGYDDAAIYARVNQVDQARIAGDTALALRSSRIEASSAASSGGLASNPTFAAWPDGQRLPTGWVDWGASESLIINRGPSGRSDGGWLISANQNAPDIDVGFVQGAPGLTTPGWYVIDVEADLESGFWVGAGITVAGVINISFATTPDHTGLVSATKTGTRRWSLSFQKGDENWLAFHAMMSWGGFGLPREQKVIRWRRMSIRMASDADAAVPVLSARVETTERALATAELTFAERATRIEASSAASSGGLAANPTFARWPDGQRLPTGWFAWGQAEQLQINRGSSGRDDGGWLININQGAPNIDAGFVQEATGLGPAGSYVIEVEAELVAGTWHGSGVTIAGQISFSFTDVPDQTGVVSATKPGIRRWSLPFQKADQNWTAFHAMMSWMVFGERPQKVINWRRMAVRPLSEPERAVPALSARVAQTETATTDGRFATAQRAGIIEATVNNAVARLSSAETALSDGRFAAALRVQTLEADYDGTKVTVTEQAGVIAGLGQRLGAYWQVGADVGNGRRQLTVYADANGGGGVDIVGDVRVSGSLLVEGSVITGKIANQAVTDGVLAQFGALTIARGETRDTPTVAYACNGGRLRVDMQFHYMGNQGVGTLNVSIVRRYAGQDTVINRVMRVLTAGEIPYGYWVKDGPFAGTVEYFLRFTTDASLSTIDYPMIAVEEFKK